MTELTPKVSALLNQENWYNERRRLRDIILSSGLEEAVRWGKLCYAHEGGNIAIIYALKSYCAVGFFKGSLLDNGHERLVAPGRHSRAMRQTRFSDLAEIEADQDQLLAHLDAAKRLEISGAEVDFSASPEPVYPDELRDALDSDAEFAEAFVALTPGRQRGYVIHFSNAKRSATRRSRIEKSRAKVLAGQGLNERVRRNR